MLTATALILLALVPFSSQDLPPKFTFQSLMKFFYDLFKENEKSSIITFYSFTSNILGSVIDLTQGEKVDDAPSSTNSFFKNFKLSSMEMSKVALNTILLIAQTVSKSFPAPHAGQGTQGSKISIVDTVLQQPMISRMLTLMEDPRLMDRVLLELDETLVDEKSDCVQQLFCRCTPVVEGIQNALLFFLRKSNIKKGTKLRGDPLTIDNMESTKDIFEEELIWNKLPPVERFYFFMPTLEDFIIASKRCRKRYPQCMANNSPDIN